MNKGGFLLLRLEQICSEIVQRKLKIAALIVLKLSTRSLRQYKLGVKIYCIVSMNLALALAKRIAL